MVRHTSIRTILTLVANKDMYLEHMDVRTSFHHSNLEEQIYLEHLEDFRDIGHGRIVCKVKSTLYGLKQSPRKWY